MHECDKITGVFDAKENPITYVGVRYGVMDSVMLRFATTLEAADASESVAAALFETVYQTIAYTMSDLSCTVTCAAEAALSRTDLFSVARAIGCTTHTGPRKQDGILLLLGDPGAQ